MTAQTKTTLKSYFETDDVPTQSNFEDLIDSLLTGAVAQNITWTTDDTNTVGADAARPSILWTHELRIGKGSSNAGAALNSTNFEIYTGYLNEKISVYNAGASWRGLAFYNYIGTTTWGRFGTNNSNVTQFEHSGGGLVSFPSTTGSALSTNQFAATNTGQTAAFPGFLAGGTGNGMFYSTATNTRLGFCVGTTEVLNFFAADNVANFVVDHASSPANNAPQTNAPDDWLKIKMAGTVYHVPLYT